MKAILLSAPFVLVLLLGCDDKGWDAKRTKWFLETCELVNKKPDAFKRMDCQCTLTKLRNNGITSERYWNAAQGNDSATLNVIETLDAACTNRAGEARWTVERQAEFYPWCAKTGASKPTCDCVLNQVILRNLEYDHLQRLLGVKEELLTACFAK